MACASLAVRANRGVTVLVCTGPEPAERRRGIRGRLQRTPPARTLQEAGHVAPWLWQEQRGALGSCRLSA
eukprot:7965583-Lingulodinium_polyedra.AAC.1